MNTKKATPETGGSSKRAFQTQENYNTERQIIEENQLLLLELAIEIGKTMEQVDQLSRTVQGRCHV